MGDDPREEVDPFSEDPYEGVDTSELPGWWQDCIEEFRAHDLHTYVPAQFADGRIVHSVVESLESDHDVDVRLLRLEDSPGGDWDVLVDGDRVGSVPRDRVREGFSVVGVDSDEFRDLVLGGRPPGGED